MSLIGQTGGTIGISSDNKKFIRVKPVDTGNGSIIGDIVFDAMTGEEPDNVTEIFKYYNGGLAGTLVATVTVVYSNASKEFVTSVVRV